MLCFEPALGGEDHEGVTLFRLEPYSALHSDRCHGGDGLRDGCSTSPGRSNHPRPKPLPGAVRPDAERCLRERDRRSLSGFAVVVWRSTRRFYVRARESERADRIDTASCLVLLHTGCLSWRGRFLL